MDDKNKFRGQFLTVDINSITPNDWNPKEDINDNEENRMKYQKVKDSIVAKQMYLPIIVRTLSEGKYEVIDGYHRWLACKELEYTQMMVWNLGEVTREEAQVMTIDSIYLTIPPSEPLTAKLVKQINEAAPDMLKLLAFDDLQIKEYLEIANFDFDKAYPNTPLPEGLGKQQNTYMIFFDEDQAKVVKQTIEKMKEKEENIDLSDARIIELICADYLGGE